MPEQGYDIGIIGGGIVGLATAMELLMRYPALRECLNRIAQGKARARCESMRLLAESHHTRRLFGSMVRQIETPAAASWFSVFSGEWNFARLAKAIEGSRRRNLRFGGSRPGSL